MMSFPSFGPHPDADAIKLIRWGWYFSYLAFYFCYDVDRDVCAACYGATELRRYGLAGGAGL